MQSMIVYCMAWVHCWPYHSSGDEVVIVPLKPRRLLAILALVAEELSPQIYKHIISRRMTVRNQIFAEFGMRYGWGGNQ